MIIRGELFDHQFPVTLLKPVTGCVEELHIRHNIEKMGANIEFVGGDEAILSFTPTEYIK